MADTPHHPGIFHGALFLLTGVAAGAFGAHGLKSIVNASLLATWQTAVLYQLVHGLGLLIIAVLYRTEPAPSLLRVGRIMTAGILVFSGSLYLRVLLDISWLGAITPVGGVLFLIAWGLLALGMRRPANPDDRTHQQGGRGRRQRQDGQ